MDKEARIKTANNEILAICKKYDLDIGFKIDFPRYKQLPEEVKLALLVLQNNGLSILLELVDNGEVKT